MRSILLPLILAIVSANAQDVTTRLADLTAVRDDLPRRHPGFFAVTSRADFEAAADALGQEAAALTTTQFYVRLLALAALAHDAHTSISLGGTPAASLGFTLMPVAFRWFDDGLFVIAAEDAYEELNAARVVAIQGQPVDQVLDRLRPVIAHENEPWFRYLAPGFVANFGVLRGLGVVPETEQPEFTFRLATGEIRKVAIGARTDAALRGPYSRTPGFNTVAARRTNEIYWAEYWPESRTVYVAYRVCQESPAKPIAEFTREVIGLAQSGPVDTMIFDLRGNTGGNSLHFDRLVEGLSGPLGGLLQNRQFRAFGLIDRGTFSSGMLAAESLKRPLDLPPGFGSADGSAPFTLVGEATGGKPAGWGEVLPFTLPGSGLRGQYSTKFFRPPAHIPDLPSIEPDVPVKLHSTDYFARHDPFLAAVFARAKRGGAAPAPAGDVIVVNAASARADAAIAPGSLVFALGNFGEQPATVRLNGQEIVPNFQVPKQLLLTLPPELQPGPVVIEVTPATGTQRGEFTISTTGPGLFTVFEHDPAQLGAISRAGDLLTIMATGLVAQRPLV